MISVSSFGTTQMIQLQHLKNGQKKIRDILTRSYIELDGTFKFSIQNLQRERIGICEGIEI
jgi:hypothetical protein